MEVSFTRRFNACEAFTAYSTACRFRTGSAPGIPRQTGHTFVLGPEPKTLGQPQKILLRVSSCTCTSRPITVSYFDSTPASLFAAIAMVPPIIRFLPPRQARAGSGSCEGPVATSPRLLAKLGVHCPDLPARRNSALQSPDASPSLAGAPAAARTLRAVCTTAPL